MGSGGKAEEYISQETKGRTAGGLRALMGSTGLVGFSTPDLSNDLRTSRHFGINKNSPSKNLSC